MSSIFNRRYKDYSERKKVIDKVETVLNGDAYEYYKQKFYNPNSSKSDDDEVMKRLFTDYKLLNQVLENFKSFCPTLKPQSISESNKKNIKDKKKRLVDTAIKTISWDKINSEIYDILEVNGDCFFYIYFDDTEVISKKDKFRIPKISLLKSKNMIDILKDDSNETLAYIYEDNIVQNEIDYETGNITENDLGTAKYIFKKGEVFRYIQGKKESGNLSVDEQGVLKIKKIENSESYKDIIPIIHIPSNKRQDEKFSAVPAQDYVELCLQLMQIQSDIRATNRQLGFPRITLLDCKYVEGDGRIGGVKRAVSVSEENEYMDKQGQVIQHSSATNESFFKEEDRVTDYLYNLVGVTNPTLMKRVGSSDSSKVMQQVNARMEKKIERYVNNIIDAFTVYFKILFLENNVYNEYDENFSFEIPRSIIKNSPYDDLLLDQLGINIGKYTIQDLLRKQGKTDEEIEKHFEQLNKEIVNGKNDIEINKEIEHTVKNANSKLKE